MAKATVCEQLPVGVDLRDVVVELALVADVDDPAAAGFAVASRLTVAGVRWAEPDAAGVVTFTGVEPNTGDGDDVIDAPTGTVWRRTIRWPDHTESVDHIEVPEPAEDGERMWVPDLLTDAPGALPSTALAAFQATAGLPGGLATLDGDGNLTAAQAPAHGDVSGRSVAGAHPASAIAVTAVSGVAGDDVQEVLESLAAGPVPNASLASMPEATVKGRQVGAGTGAPQDLTAAQARAVLGLGSAALAATADFDPAGSAAAALAAATAASQPLDSDLTAIAALSTTAFGRGLLALADAAALRAAAGLGAAATLSVGSTPGTVAAGDHDHTGVYAAAGHDHDSTYVNGDGDTMTGALEFTDPTEGVILTSPDSTRWRVTVGDDGALTTTEVP